MLQVEFDETWKQDIALQLSSYLYVNIRRRGSLTGFLY